MTANTIFHGGSPVGTPILLLLVQICIIISFARLLAQAISYIKQPAVVAEMISGILLGPSVLGKIPNFTDKIFPASSMVVLQMIAKLAVYLYMFLVGMSLDLKEIGRCARPAIAAVIPGMAIPIGLAFATSFAFDEGVHYKGKWSLFSFFYGIMLGISALPVLARILTASGFLHTPFGALVISGASIDDIIAWPLVAIGVSVARASGGLSIFYVLLALVLTLLFMRFVVPPFMQFVVSKADLSHEVPPWLLFFVFVSLFFLAWVTEVVDITAVLGSFLTGLAIPRHPVLLRAITTKIYDFTVIILLPLFFGVSGLRTDLSLLDSWKAWGLVLMMCTLAFVGKISGVFLGARPLGNSTLESFAFGIFMTTKGLVALIAANIARDEGIFTDTFFSITVAYVIIVTFLIVPFTNLLPLGKSKNTRPRGADDDDAAVVSSPLALAAANKSCLGLVGVAPLWVPELGRLVCARVMDQPDLLDSLSPAPTADKLAVAIKTQGKLLQMGVSVFPITTLSPSEGLGPLYVLPEAAEHAEPAPAVPVLARGAPILAAWVDSPTGNAHALLVDLLAHPLPVLAVLQHNVTASVRAVVVVFRHNQHALRDLVAGICRGGTVVFLFPLDEGSPADVAAWGAVAQDLKSRNIAVKTWPGAAEAAAQGTSAERLAALCSGPQGYDAVLVQADTRTLTLAHLAPAITLLREQCLKPVLVYFDRDAAREPSAFSPHLPQPLAAAADAALGYFARPVATTLSRTRLSEV